MVTYNNFEPGDLVKIIGSYSYYDEKPGDICLIVNKLDDRGYYVAFNFRVRRIQRIWSGILEKLG